MTPDELERALGGVLSAVGADGETCAGGLPATALYAYVCRLDAPDERRAFAAHLDACGDCRADLAAYDRPAPAPLAASSAPLGVVAAVVAAVALCVGVGVVVRRPGDDPVMRVKGGFHLQVAVERGAQRFVLKSDDALHEGDVLGFFATAPRPGFVAVLVVDPDGAAAQIFPAAGGAAAPVGAGVERRLSDGARVGAGDRCEWIVGLFSPQPFMMDDVRPALIQAAVDARDTCALPSPALPAAVTGEVVRVRR